MDIDDLKLPIPVEFEWDGGNKIKSHIKHGITNQEAEEVFSNFNIVLEDKKHSIKEPRYIILGKSNNNKVIFSSFIVRNRKVRLVSSRSANSKERVNYEETLKKNS